MLYRLLYFIYFKIPFKEDSLAHRLYIRLLNSVIPFYFKNNILKPKLGKTNGNIVVSLTSFPERIHLVTRVIESMLYQTIQPKCIVLWLSMEEFPIDYQLPLSLQKLQRRGLTVHWVAENLKAHKKYFYVFDKFPNLTVLTIDDDEYYPPGLIAHFLHFHRKYPEAIIGSKARKIGVHQGRFLPYSNWEIFSGFHSPSDNLINIGSGGIVYPGKSLSKRIFNSDLIQKFALLADDLWIKFANEKKTAKNMCVGHKFPHKFIPILAVNQTPSLFDINVNHCHNDKVLHDLHENLSIDGTRYEAKSESE